MNPQGQKVMLVSCDFDPCCLFSTSKDECRQKAAMHVTLKAGVSNLTADARSPNTKQKSVSDIKEVNTRTAEAILISSELSECQQSS